MKLITHKDEIHEHPFESAFNGVQLKGIGLDYVDVKKIYSLLADGKEKQVRDQFMNLMLRFSPRKP